jgi:hypothetical protein
MASACLTDEVRIILFFSTELNLQAYRDSYNQEVGLPEHPSKHMQQLHFSHSHWFRRVSERLHVRANVQTVRMLIRTVEDQPRTQRPDPLGGPFGSLS